MEAARIVGSSPKAKRYQHVCPLCGKTFLATARGKWCSAICRARDQTRRKTAARRARWVGTEWEPKPSA
jgi:hypothetical protein